MPPERTYTTALSSVSLDPDTWTSISGGMSSGSSYRAFIENVALARITESATSPASTLSAPPILKDGEPVDLTYDGTAWWVKATGPGGIVHILEIS